MELPLSPVDCFVDDLMDQGIINVDFNFGEVSAEYTGDHISNEQYKLSPSHESDSGVSNMTSPSPSTVSELDEEPEYTDLQTPDFGMFDDVIDNELAGYLTSSVRSPSPEVFSIEPEIGKDVSEPLVPDSLIQQNESKQNDKCKRVLRSNDINKNCVQKQVVSSSKPVVTVNSNIPAKSVPQVKVIKVISAPANSSKSDTDKKIYEALDERNRKNAVQAKINREKKKAYIKTLEDDIENLRSENTELKAKQQESEFDKQTLEEEIAYLKNIIANQSALSGLLQNIPNTNGVKLTTSFKRKRGAEHDHNYQGSSVKRARTAGVCLHVNKDNVSLEFCSRCSQSAVSDV